MITDTFNLSIVTPERQVVSKDVGYMSAPGSVGEFGVLPGHTEFFTTLKPGEIRYEDESGEHYLSVSWGYAEVKGDEVIILADSAEHAEEIDVERANLDRERWEKELSSLTMSDEKYGKIKQKLDRANARLNAIDRLIKK
jgi:F-type H+-transporting ATPase subunit epsilon